jgi:transposase-like protein
MPILPPVAASGKREPERAVRRIPAKVRACVVSMVTENLDLVAASRLHDVRPATMRTWLHRPEIAALVRKERQAYRLAISCGTEAALVDIRDNREGNQMARVAAAKAIVEIDRDEYARPAADRVSPGITLKFVTLRGTDRGHYAGEGAAPRGRR